MSYQNPLYVQTEVQMIEVDAYAFKYFVFVFPERYQMMEEDELILRSKEILRSKGLPYEEGEIEICSPFPIRQDGKRSIHFRMDNREGSV